MNKLSDKYYIMGCGILGKYLYKFFANNYNMKFMGFLDNLQRGENIFKPDLIENKNISVIVASINYMYEMSCQLKELGFKNIINFAELTLEYPELQNFNQAFLGLKEDYKNNKEKYEQLKTLLADEKSKQVLNTIIEFRKTFDIGLYPKIADDINKQYFEDFMPKNEKIFIDGGAFDGDTVLRAYRCGYNFEKIYFFEPDKTSMTRAKENLKNIKNVQYFNNGLSDDMKILQFTANGTFGSHFEEQGEEKIECVSLDKIIEEDKAFIKLDIEGAEKAAIIGAKRLFENNSPFAICVYHKPEDLWEIPQLIQNISHNGYKLYLRHYTNSILDTILYGVPND